MKYRVVYEHEPDGRWTVEVPSVPGCHSYGRTIEQARERIREALRLFVDSAATADFDERIEMPHSVRHAVNVAQQMRVSVDQQAARMVAAQRKAVHALRHKMRLGLRDAGELLGVSHQRVQQIESDIPLMPGAVVAAAQRTRRLAKRAAKKR